MPTAEQRINIPELQGAISTVRQLDASRTTPVAEATLRRELKQEAVYEQVRVNVPQPRDAGELKDINEYWPTLPTDQPTSSEELEDTLRERARVHRLDLEQQGLAWSA